MKFKTFAELEAYMSDVYALLFDVAHIDCDNPINQNKCLACEAHSLKDGMLDQEWSELATAEGFIRLAPDEVVVKRGDIAMAIDEIEWLETAGGADGPSCRARMILSSFRYALAAALTTSEVTK